MEFTVGQFLVIEKHVWDELEDDHDVITYNADELLLLPIDKRVPIITKNFGCEGYAHINEITLRKDGTTTVKFKFIGNVSHQTCEALYEFYRSTNSSGNRSRSSSFNTEEIIPGLYNGKRGRR